MSISIYELADQYKEVESMLYDQDCDTQTVIDTLEAIDGEIEDKSDNYAKLIKNLLADAETIETEEKRLIARRHAIEARVQGLKTRLQANLEFIGKTKFKTALFSFSVSKNGGKQPLEITENLQEIPGKFLIPQPPVVDKDAVRTLLKEKEVEWAALKPYGTHLNIR